MSKIAELSQLVRRMQGFRPSAPLETAQNIDDRPELTPEQVEARVYLTDDEFDNLGDAELESMRARISEYAPQSRRVPPPPATSTPPLILKAPQQEATPKKYGLLNLWLNVITATVPRYFAWKSGVTPVVSGLEHLLEGRSLRLTQPALMVATHCDYLLDATLVTPTILAALHNRAVPLTVTKTPDNLGIWFVQRVLLRPFNVTVDVGDKKKAETKDARVARERRNHAKMQKAAAKGRTAFVYPSGTTCTDGKREKLAKLGAYRAFDVVSRKPVQTVPWIVTFSMLSANPTVYIRALAPRISGDADIPRSVPPSAADYARDNIVMRELADLFTGGAMVTPEGIVGGLLLWLNRAVFKKDNIDLIIEARKPREDASLAPRDVQRKWVVLKREQLIAIGSELAQAIAAHSPEILPPPLADASTRAEHLSHAYDDLLRRGYLEADGRVTSLFGSIADQVQAERALLGIAPRKDRVRLKKDPKTGRLDPRIPMEKQDFPTRSLHVDDPVYYNGNTLIAQAEVVSAINDAIEEIFGRYEAELVKS